MTVIMSIVFVITITFENWIWANNVFGIYWSILATILNDFCGEEGHVDIELSGREVYFIYHNVISRSHYYLVFFSH